MNDGFVDSGDGNVYSWGRGTFGRLGTGSDADQFSPFKVQFNSTNKIVAISAGAYHTIALAGNIFLPFIQVMGFKHGQPLTRPLM